MVKNWGDHSSDEESLDDLPQQFEAQQLEEAGAGPPPPQDIHAAGAPPEGNRAPKEPRGPRTYEFPDHPPFTAFIGNLAYSLKEPEDLKQEVMKCVKDNLGQDINILGARISFGRDGKHRGFGYLEVENVDQVRKMDSIEVKLRLVSGEKISSPAPSISSSYSCN